MGVYIKGMKMPNTCQICRTARFDRIIDCEVFDRLSIGEQMYKRSASCPLVEVPPHGRLIDVEMLNGKMYDSFESNPDMQMWKNGCWIKYEMFENNLRDTPTIIEREDDDEYSD